MIWLFGVAFAWATMFHNKPAATLAITWIFARIVAVLVLLAIGGAFLLRYGFTGNFG